ncbi:MAG TPA: fimbria/pilus periplasmic chaperone [Sphingomicrobium sp.]|nr:fimbria/pilus periplasmic chaperone [Sphingomicrobium sp.]
MIKRKPILAALLAVGCLYSAQAPATSLEITPVGIHLVPGQRATTIELMNRGGVAAAIHLRAFAWTQQGDRDVLTPTQDIVLSPPIFTVPTGATQTVRLLLRRGANGTGQRSYRLLIDEVPPANARDQQILIAMRVSLPLIIAPAAPAPHALKWRAHRGAGGQIILSATNIGNVYDRVTAIAVTLPDGSRPIVAPAGDNPYILAGAQRRWTVQAGRAAAATGELRLNLTTQSGSSEQVLALAP